MRTWPSITDWSPGGVQSNVGSSATGERSVSESMYQSKVERLRKEIANLERKRSDAAKQEARHRDSARRSIASIKRTTSAGTADSRRRHAASEERWADRERDKGNGYQKTIADKHRDLAQAEKSLLEARARRLKTEADRERRDRDLREREVRSLRQTVGLMSRDLDAVTAALVRELPASITVLLIYADPTGGLRLDEEMRSIYQATRLSEHRDHVKLEARWAARPADVSQALVDTKPTVVHISGHGRDDGALVFQSDDGGERFVPASDLVGLVRAVGEHARVMLFNSCSSEVAAQVASDHVEAAIGMDAPVTDLGARAFAEGFYRAVGGGMSVAQAFEVGRFELRNTPGDRIDEAEPVLKTAPGVDPASIFLVSPAADADSGTDGVVA
jgi:hypothetical protein